MTGQMTCTSEKVRRTKFFFGARYMWSKQQLSEPHSRVGAGQYYFEYYLFTCKNI